MNEPTAPLERVKFFVNLDMIGRLRDGRLEVIGSRTAAGLRRLVVLRAAESGLRLEFPWKIKRDSDHWTFYQRGIPCLLFHTGKHADYHRPSDDADKINAAGIQKIDRLLFELVLGLADREQVPAFREAARAETASDRLALEQPLPAAPPRLGVWWDALDRRLPGLLITRVAAGSPAQAAGLRAGDRLLRFNGETPRTSGQLRRAVFAAPRNVELTVARSGEPEPLTLSVALAGEPARVGIAWREDAGEPQSVLLTRVALGSPAARAGLRAGDRIYRVDGADFLGGRDFRGRIEVAEGPTQLLVERAGRARQIEIVLPTIDPGA
jgi:membrane-associated protease RseP (regulator of RpoE activity)